MNIIVKGYRKRTMQESISTLIEELSLQRKMASLIPKIEGAILPVDSSNYKSFKRDMLNARSNISDDDCIRMYFSIMLYNSLQSVGFDAKHSMYSFEEFIETFTNSVILWDNDILMQNPYVKNIKLSNIQLNDWKFCQHEYKPMETLVNYTMYKDTKTICVGEYGIAKEFISFPALVNTKTYDTWMSISPSEIVTMQEHIDYAFGNVLVLGCGLGYYEYMIHLKDNVQSVTIIESDENVINLFNEYILPQFDYKEKIKVVHSDAYEYLNTIVGCEYNYCFADIWLSPMDGLVHYMKLKPYEAKMQMKFGYWIEEAILDTVSFMMYDFVLQAVGEANYAFSYNLNPIYKIVQDKIGDIVINTSEELLEIVSIPKIRELLS